MLNRHARGDGPMAKTLPVSVRMDPETKKAVEAAARDDDRPVSSMIERILKLWLRDNGYLPKEGGL
ncbi:ribbon-helix-helix protein, CopG family [Roseospira marina]|uniref:Ribbon-helix-helix protein, CopG family n=2 Tax=Roseospira marina TaxID=140057 RepID=A0A5M6I7C9_9PROT|nr:ribbon-helix-helix protein, CopG family [Roseospira marina]